MATFNHREKKENYNRYKKETVLKFVSLITKTIACNNQLMYSNKKKKYIILDIYISNSCKLNVFRKRNI